MRSLPRVDSVMWLVKKIMNIQKLHWDAISFSYENNQIYKIIISEYPNYNDKLDISLFIWVTPKACVLYMGHPSLLYITCYISKERWPMYKTSACVSPLPSNSEKGISCEYAHLHSMSLTSKKVKLKKNCQDKKPREWKTYWMKNRYMS